MNCTVPININVILVGGGIIIPENAAAAARRPHALMATGEAARWTVVPIRFY